MNSDSLNMVCAIAWLPGNLVRQSLNGTGGGRRTVLKMTVGRPATKARGQMRAMTTRIRDRLHSRCALIGCTIAMYLQTNVNNLKTLYLKI